jgi:hypothetical protein
MCNRLYNHYAFCDCRTVPYELILGRFVTCAQHVNSFTPVLQFLSFMFYCVMCNMQMLQQGLDSKCEFQDFVGVDNNVLSFNDH